MTTAIDEYKPTEAALAELEQKYKAVVFDCTTKTGMAQAKEGRAQLRGLRIALEKERVRIKEPALKRAREIDTEAKRITGVIEALEDPIHQQIKLEEDKAENERKAKEAAEAARVADIQTRIATIGNLVSGVLGNPSHMIQETIDKLQADDVTTWAAELAPQAQIAKDAALHRMNGILANIKAGEEEAARLQAQREELDRRQAEQEARDRADAERRRQEDERRAQDERIAREKREAEEAAHRAKLAAEEKAAREKREAEEAEARARIEAQEREAKERREAEELAAAEVRRKEQAEREAREAEQRAAQERIDAENKRQREEAERQERERVRLENERAGARDMLATFKERFSHMKEVAGVVKAIDAFFKANPQ